MMVINKENIEEYLLLFIDGELSEAEEGEVLAFVDRYPEFQVLLDAFLQTKLDDATIVFEDKESLLKQEVTVLLIMPIKRKRISLAIAAAIAVLIGLGFVLRIVTNTNEPVEPSVASLTTIEKITDTTSAKKWVVESSKKEETKQSKTIHFVKQKVKEETIVASITPSDRKNIEGLEPLPTANYSAIAINEASKDIAIDVERLKPVIVQEDKEESRGWSPINAEKLELFSALIAQVETLKDELQSKSKSLKITTVAIRLGGKEFTIGK